jgi:hypothetical protein
MDNNIITFRRRPRCVVCGKAIENEALKRCDQCLRSQRIADMEERGMFAAMAALAKKIRVSAGAGCTAIDDPNDLVELLVNLEAAFRQIEYACKRVAEATGAESPDMDERLREVEDFPDQAFAAAREGDAAKEAFEARVREAYEARAREIGPLGCALDELAQARNAVAQVWVALSPDE